MILEKNMNASMGSANTQFNLALLKQHKLETGMGIGFFVGDTVPKRLVQEDSPRLFGGKKVSEEP
jgi:hypothetical protein